MLGSCDVIAFIPTVQPDRAREFYERVLGLRFVSSDEYAMMFDGHGVRIRIARVREFAPYPFTILGWLVPDIAASVRDLMNRGISFERYGFLAQDNLGICTFPSGGRVAWFKDPDGNTLSLTQSGSM